MKLSLGLGIGASIVPAVVRTLDTAGPELVTNGQFPSDISGWTDASSAGGAISWVSTGGGRMRVTNTSGFGRARQTVPVTIGQRYAYTGFNPAGTVTEIVALGHSAPGSTEYLNNAPSLGLPPTGRAGMVEFTATTANAYISFITATAGYGEVDNSTLRRLIPTTFARGTVFTQDFSATPDGQLTVTPDSLPWRQIIPVNAAYVFPYIESGKMNAANSGGSTTASYPYLDLGDGKVAAMYCDGQWSAEGTIALVAVNKTGSRLVVGDILANSVHIVFTATKVDITTFVGSVNSTETVNYASPLVTDGRTYAGLGWSLSGNTITITLPDGSTLQRTDSKFAQVQGACAVPEIFYATGAPGPVTISKVSVTLG